jgi:hypothetical protein
MDQKLTAGVAEGKRYQLFHIRIESSQVKEAMQNGQMRRQRVALWRLKWLRLGEAVRHHSQ